MIKDLKDLKALLKLCRANGVTDFKWGDITLKMEASPVNTNPDVADLEDAEAEFIRAVEAPLTHEEAVAFAAGA